jgi:hypothetical protein
VDDERTKMPRYLLSVHSVEGAPVPTEEETKQMFADVGVFNEKLMATGAWVFADGLEPVDLAVTVRLDGDTTVVSDGPFAETKEHLGGFWIIDAPSLEAATALAREGAIACKGDVEVRAFQILTND